MPASCCCERKVAALPGDGGCPCRDLAQEGEAFKYCAGNIFIVGKAPLGMGAPPAKHDPSARPVVHVAVDCSRLPHAFRWQAHQKVWVVRASSAAGCCYFAEQGCAVL